MPHDDRRTAALLRRLALARRGFCRHLRSALRAQACAVQFSGGPAGARTAIGCDGIPSAEARRLGRRDAVAAGGLPPGFAHALSAAYPVAGGELRIVVLRGLGEPAFTAPDALTLDGFAGLGGTMLDLAAAAAGMAALWQGSLQVLDRLAIGVVLVGAGGELLASNRTARDIALGHTGDSTAGRAQEHALRTLSQSVRRGNGSTADTAAAFARLETGGERRVSVLTAPLAGPDGGGPGARPGTALFLADAGRLFAPYQDWLIRLYGLTRLEAQLVTQMIEGRSLSDIAAALHISIHTVRSYLKQIFGKTGVHRQAELVKLVVGGIGQVRADIEPPRGTPLT